MTQPISPAPIGVRQARRFVFLILAVMTALQAYQAWRTGITIDEPSHLLSSYLYWRGADRLPPADMPPAIKIISGWVPNLFGLPVPGDLGHEGDSRHEWHASAAITNELPAARLKWPFFASRLPLLAFPVLTGLLIWHWGRQLFRPTTACVLVLLYALEPTALAHGSLVKNDIAATLGYLFFWYWAWRFWREPGLRTAAWIGLATLAALMAKLSMFFLLIASPLIILLRYSTLRTARIRLTAASLLMALAIPYAGSVVAYQFEVQRVRRSYLAVLSRQPGAARYLATVSHLFRAIPIPSNLWRGTVALVFSNASTAKVYMMGKIWPEGHPLYFAVALAVKIPVALQVTVISGFVLLVFRLARARIDVSDLFWILPGFLYIFLASLSALQLGIRLILPALPFGLFIAGMAIDSFLQGRRTYVLAATLVLFMAESLSIYPHGISFFNLWTGGPRNGLRYLADSNLDWGQGLPDLARYVKANKIRHFRLAYFGADNAWNYFDTETMEPLAPPWEEKWIRGTELALEPGIYAISATLLPGHYFGPKYRRYFSAFWNLRPEGIVAYSIYVYRVKPDQGSNSISQ